MTATEPITKTFYSHSSGLYISPEGMKGELVSMGNQTVRINEKGIQFVPLGAEAFGYFTTDDPQLIEYLEKRAKRVGDVFGHEEFLRRSTPATVRLEQMQRELEEKNRLLAKLQNDSAAKEAKQQQAQK